MAALLDAGPGAPEGEQTVTLDAHLADRERGSPIAQSAILTIGRVGAAAVAILLPIALVRALDLASVGRYKLFFLIASTLGTLLSLGIPASLYFFLPRHPTHRRALLVRSTTLLVGAGILAAMVIEVSRPLLASRFHLTDHREVLLAALYTAVSLPAALLPVIATTDGRVGLASAAIAGFDVLRALAMLGAALIYRRVDAVLAGAAGVAVLQLLALGGYVLRQPGERRPRKTEDMPSVGRAQLSYAVSYQGAIVANLVREQAHAYYVAGVVAPSAYAIYAVGLLQVPFVGAAAQSLNDVLIVHGSEMHARGDTPALVALWHRAVLALALFAVPAFATLWVFAPELFRVLFGPAYVASVPVFRLSLLLLPMSVPLLHTMLRATGRTGVAARAELLTLFVALGTLPLLVSRFGTIGAVISLVVASLVFQVSGSSALARELHRRPTDFLPWGALLRLGLFAGASAVTARALTGFLPPIGRLAIGAPIAIAACLTVAWYRGLVAEGDRARVLATALRWRHAAMLPFSHWRTP